MKRTVPHDPTDPAEVAAVQTPDGEPDGELCDPDETSDVDESSEVVLG